MSDDVPHGPPTTLPPGSRAVVFGLTGSGKTRLVRSLLPSHSRCLIVDPLREYGADAVAVRSFDELEDYLAATHGAWRIAYQGEELDDEFDTLCDVAVSLGPCLFVVEEADMFCDPTSISERFEHLIKYGRHARTHPLCVSRTPSEMHRLLTRQAYEIYAFTIAEPRDLDYLRRYVSERFADGLAALPWETYRTFNRWTRAIHERRLGDPLTGGRRVLDNGDEEPARSLGVDGSSVTDGAGSLSDEEDEPDATNR